MNKNFWYILGVGILLIFICGFLISPVSAADPLIAKPCPSGMSAITVNPQDIIPYDTCADLTIVSGWDRKMIHTSGSPVIDISAFTKKIWIESSTWKLGRYNQWSSNPDDKGNLFAFVVVEKTITKEEIKNITKEIPASLIPAIEMNKYNLPEKPVADVLIARGDQLSFNTSIITNESIAWLFGVTNGIYAFPCNDSQLLIPASLMKNMPAGDYKIVIEYPGHNTIIEAEYISEHKDPSEHDRIVSQFRKTPPLDIEGQSPRNIYDRFLPWLKQYSDDPILEFKLAIEDPRIDIIGVGTSYTSTVTDVLQVDGYTNLELGSNVFAVLDENNRTYAIINPPRTYSKTAGSITKPGTMREFRIMIPVERANKTIGRHFITVHGSFDTFATVEWYIYNAPAGSEQPDQYNKYVAGNLFVPTPTPEIVIKEITKVVIQTQFIPVTPSDEQVYTQQKKVTDENNEIWLWRIIIVLVIIGVIWYMISLYLRRRELG